MARFSIGREDDGEGPSSPRPKKQRITTTRTQQQQQDEGELVLEEDVIEEEEDAEEEEEEGEEEEEVEVEVELEDCNGDHRRTSAGQTSIGASINGTDPDTAGSNGDGSISVTLTDPDVLDCPICLESLSIPVFQCENGHIACSFCCSKLRNKCPSCSWPIGYNRCRAIEKVIESVKISCRNIKYGCTEAVSYSKKHDHEQSCIHAPCSCPLPDCNFVGSSKHLYVHVSSKHSNSVTRFCYDCLFSISFEFNQKYRILQEQNEGVIFIVNHAVEPLGRVVNVNCIGLSSSKRGFTYDLIARNGDSSIRFQSFTQSFPIWFEHFPRKLFLLVPSDFVSSCGQLRFQICIWKHRENHTGVRRLAVCYS